MKALWLSLLASGCLSVPGPESTRNVGVGDDGGDDDAGSGNAPDAGDTPDADPARIFVGRYILQPYFTAAGTCAEGTGSYNFRVDYAGEYTLTNEHAYTDQSFSFDEATRHFTIESEIDTYTPYRYVETYSFALDLAADGVTVTGTGDFSLYEYDVMTCTNPIEVTAGYIE